MKKIHVLQLVLNLDIGGSENCVVNLVRALDKTRFDVSVCCVLEGGVLEQKLAPLDIPVYTLKKGPGFQLKTIRKLAQLLRKIKVDVIHSHHLGPLIYGWPAAKMAGIKTIIHTEHSYQYMQENKKNFWTAKVLFNNITKLVGVCDDVSLFFRNTMHIPPSRITTVVNGIDIEQFSKNDGKSYLLQMEELGITKNDFVIGTVARLDPVKNQENLLHAFKKAVALIPEAKLIIVGDGPLKNHLTNLSKELEIEDHIKLLGFRSDTPECLKMMDVFILPSLSEGLSLALLEAMTAKCPIIASNVDGNKELITDYKTGFLVSPHNPKNIAEAMMTLYNKKELRIQLAEEAYQLVHRQYSMNTMTKAYEKLYNV